MPPIVRLFIVPWLAAGIRSGTAWANALNNTSTMRCDISTFPPATDPGGFPSTSHLPRHQTANHVQHCRNRDRLDCIDRTRNLRRAPGEINQRALPLDCYAHL